MEKISLSELVIRVGQAKVASELNVRPPSIAGAIKAGRKITVTVHDDGSYSAEEVRTFPSQKPRT